MNQKPLPVGVQTFRKIIEGGFLYVDKTPWLYELIKASTGVYFLSRPRRFGKSLLLSTLAEIFQGNRELFRGLWLDQADYNWETHPVIRVDFSLARVQSADQLEAVIGRYLQDLAAQHHLTLQTGFYHQQFADLIVQLSQQNKVVILIDEYDKPILDNITDLSEAQRIRDALKGFYTVIKALDAHIRFVFLTGISKFSKVGVFSGLNNLNDISLDARYSAMLGITQAELEANFQPYLPPFAESEEVSIPELLQQIKEWYNGFCFSDRCESVYNPFSLLLLMEKARFGNYWFESGTPTFLIKLIGQRGYDVRQLEQLLLTESGFSSYEIEELAIIPLLYQTGYLSIKGYDRPRRLYTLSYPNLEVEEAFLDYLLGDFSPVDRGIAGGYLWQIVQALQEQNLVQFFKVLNVFFADIPYDIRIQQERYYQTIFYLIFKLIGLKVEAEVRTERGRIDAVIELDEAVYLFEFKLDGTAAEALAQMQQQDYAEKYHLHRRPVYLVGAAFAGREGVTAWETVLLPAKV